MIGSKSVRKLTYDRQPSIRATVAVLALGWLAAGNAQATTSESAFSTTTGAYSQTDQFGGALQLSQNVQSLLLDGGTPGNLSELGVTVSSTTGANGSFAFDQNLYRLGTGSASLTTTVMDTITNSSDASVFLRFDSQITPGHIAAQGNNSSNVVFFQFKITQISGSLDTVLYSANGAVNPNGAPSITTSDGSVFNGLESYSNGDRRALDWSATNLDLALQPIQASSSTIILYQTTTYVTGGVPCSALEYCEGTQVAFGDPRHDGGVSNAPQSASFDGLLGPSPTVPLIGRLYDPYTTYMDVVPMDAPLPPAPPVLPPVTYTPPPAPVPEPATWAMLIAGFALAGAVFRRRAAPAMPQR
jgi:hypothetical protein